jgi:hypothetical protein
MALAHRYRRPDDTSADSPTHSLAVTARALTAAPGPGHPSAPTAAGRLDAATPSALPPSVARVAARTRLSAELLAAILEVDDRRRATLDDIERADALAARLLARRAERQRATGHAGSYPRPRLSTDARLAG